VLDLGPRAFFVQAVDLLGRRAFMGKAGFQPEINEKSRRFAGW
jgi:hypothetical protein